MKLDTFLVHGSRNANNVQQIEPMISRRSAKLGKTMMTPAVRLTRTALLTNWASLAVKWESRMEDRGYSIRGYEK